MRPTRIADLGVLANLLSLRHLTGFRCKNVSELNLKSRIFRNIVYVDRMSYRITRRRRDICWFQTTERTEGTEKNSVFSVCSVVNVTTGLFTPVCTNGSRTSKIAP